MPAWPLNARSRRPPGGRCRVCRALRLAGRGSGRGGCGTVPVDVVVVGLLLSLAVGGHGQDHWQHGVAEDPGDGAGGLAVVDAGGPFDDALDTGPAGCLRGGGRRLGAGLVAQAFGEDARVFGGQGGAPGGGGGGGPGRGVGGGGGGGGRMTIIGGWSQRGRWGGVGPGVVAMSCGVASIRWAGGSAPPA